MTPILVNILEGFEKEVMVKIDTSKALERFDNDMDIYLELVTTFLDSPTPDFAEMKRLLAEGEKKAIQETMHKIKGGALTIGADDLAKISGIIEANLRNGTGIETERQLTLSQQIYNETYIALQEIKAELEKRA
jgi:HPt (histidine-containing phosphotransfer) domain-containing protein